MFMILIILFSISYCHLIYFSDKLKAFYFNFLLLEFLFLSFFGT